MKSIETGTNIIIFTVVFFLIAVISIGITMGLQDFLRELKYIKMEICRATGEERKYWKRRRRRLYLSLFRFLDK